MAKIELNNLEDLLKNKDEIKNENNKIGKFKGKIIDEISKAFKNKIIQMIEINFLELIVSYDKYFFRDNLYIKGDYYKENNQDKSEKQLIKENDEIRKITINIKDSERDYDKNPLIQFKFIRENRTKHDETINKFQYETGKNRELNLKTIKDEMIKKYNSDNKFLIKSPNGDFENFFYDFFNRTLVINCKLRDFEEWFIDTL